MKYCSHICNISMISIFFLGTNTTLIEMEAYASCVSWSSKHFTTFDGYSMTFDGKGTYTMVQECTGSEEPVYEVMIDMAYDCPPATPFCYNAIKVTIVNELNIEFPLQM